MSVRQFSKIVGAGATFAFVVAVGISFGSPRVHADDNDREESKIRQGFEIAPVRLNLDGKDRELVGLGSYIVNAQADCNGCHSLFPKNGAPTEFTPAGNPYLLRPPMGPFTGKIQVNPATYQVTITGGTPNNITSAGTLSAGNGIQLPIPDEPQHSPSQN